MSINVFTFSGNVGKDPITRSTQAGKLIATFPVAVKSGWGDHEKTSWINCKLFGARAEKLAPYIQKGAGVCISGEFTLDQWEKDGVKNSMPCVAVDSIKFDKGATQGSQGEQQAPQSPSGNQPGPPAGFDDFDDDIPF